MSDQGRVLVQIGERRRPVVVSNVDDLAQDRLIIEIRKVFSDVISEDDEFFLQYKDKEWGDEFVDVVPGQRVSNRSIIRAVLKEKVWKIYNL